jgi:hypothetical protein
LSSIVRLEWYRDPKGYFVDRVVEETRGAGVDAPGSTILRAGLPPGDYIRPMSGEREPYEVGLDEIDLVREFANTSATEDGLLAFHQKWGLLSNASLTVEETNHHRTVILWGAAHATQKQLSGHFRTLKNELLGKINVKVTGSGSLGLETAFYVSTLLQFCWFQLLQRRFGKAAVSRCRACGALLPIPVTKPRKFCGNACKTRHHRMVHPDSQDT